MNERFTGLERDLTWVALLTAGAAAGGRRHRRAALRGVLALALASGGPHLVGNDARIEATIEEEAARARILGVIGGDDTIGAAAMAAHE